MEFPYDGGILRRRAESFHCRVFCQTSREIIDMYSDLQQPAPTFYWTDMEAYAPYLLGPNAIQSMYAQNDFGSMSRYMLPEEIGSGWLEFIELKDPIRILLFDCHWEKTRTLIVRDEDWIRFNFGLDLNMFMTFGDREAARVRGPSWRVINNPKGADTIEEIPEGSKTAWVTVCCKPDYIAALAGLSQDDMPHPLRNDFYEDSPETFYQLFDFTSRLNAITADILRTRFEGGLRIAYIQSRAIELVCLALQHILHPAPDESIPVKLSERDIAALKKAHQILEKNYADPPSIKELSLKVGVNRNKLYYGFRLIFDQTVTESIQDLRLTQAKKLLIETRMSISDVASSVGFKHQCNFSTAVKKRFGMTPLSIRENQ